MSVHVEVESTSQVKPNNSDSTALIHAPNAAPAGDIGNVATR